MWALSKDFDVAPYPRGIGRWNPIEIEKILIEIEGIWIEIDRLHLSKWFKGTLPAKLKMVVIYSVFLMLEEKNFVFIDKNHIFNKWIITCITD